MKKQKRRMRLQILKPQKKTNNMRIVYFYAKEGKKIGPLNREQLDDLHLDPNTLVWHYGLSGWIPYKNLPKQVVKEDEESPFDKFCAWLKGKKKTTVKAEVPAKPVVEKPVEQAETVETPVAESQEAVVQSVVQKSNNRNEIWQKVLKVLKKVFIVLLILVGVAGVGIGGYFAYDYYENTFLPEKRLNEACSDLETKWADADKYEKRAMAVKILSKKAEWGYENVPDSDIDMKFSVPKRKAAFKLIEDEAYRGDPRCQFQMGQFYGYEDTYHVTINYTKAAYWWKEAAMNGNLSGYDNLGWAYEYGQGVSKNMEKAIECYRISAEGNDDYGLYNMGRLYETGVKVPNGYHYEQYQTFSSGPKYSEDIFVRSGVTSNYDYYKVYKHRVTDYKVILPKDMKKAREYWKKAAALGNENAKEKLQRVFE